MAMTNAEIQEQQRRLTVYQERDHGHSLKFGTGSGS